MENGDISSIRGDSQLVDDAYIYVDAMFAVGDDIDHRTLCDISNHSLPVVI